LLAAAALLLTDSRAAWLAAGAGCLLPPAFLVLRGRVVRTAWRSRSFKLWLAVAACAAIALPAAVAANTVLWRAATTLVRLHIWGGALRLWAAHPLSGAGPGA